MRRLLKEFVHSVLNEAENDAKYLEKINFRKLHQQEPDADPRELQRLAKEGPIFEKAMLNYIKRLSDNVFPRQNRKEFVKWLSNSIIIGSWPPVGAIRQVSDWINGENVTIDDLPKQFDDAYLTAARWHESLKTKSFDKEIEASGKEKVVYTFPDGFKILELSADDCRAEGPSMGHCVATHADSVEAGEERLFSLRDSRNKPHVTISVLSSGEVDEIKGRENVVPVPKYATRVKEWLHSTDFEFFHSIDYFYMLLNKEKRSFLLTLKKENPKYFLNKIWEIMSHEDYLYNLNPPKPTALSELPIEGLTKTWVGIVTSLVELMSHHDQADILSALRLISAWADDSVSDQVVSSAISSLLEYPSISKLSQLFKIPFDIKAKNVKTTELVKMPNIHLWDVGYVLHNVIETSVRPQYVIECIEKELGMPLEDFLFKG